MPKPTLALPLTPMLQRPALTPILEPLKPPNLPKEPNPVPHAWASP